MELVVDPAVDGPRWRHPATFVRLRPDLRPDDLCPRDLRPVDPPPAERPHDPQAGAAAPSPTRGHTQVS